MIQQKILNNSEHDYNNLNIIQPACFTTFLPGYTGN